MSILVLMFLLLLVALLVFRKKYHAAILCLMLSYLLLLFVGQGWVPNLLLRKLQSVPPLAVSEWRDSNAIVVLGVGAVRWPDGAFLTSHALGFSRLHEAIRLYRTCKQAGKLCSILASGGDPDKNGISEAEIMKRELIEVGVIDSDILVEINSNNTFQNAKFSSHIIGLHRFKNVVLVTSGFHVKRASMYFSYFGIQVVCSPSDRIHAYFAIIPLSHNFTLTDIAIHEYYGFLRHWFYNLVGWNAGGSTAGTP